VIGTGPNAQTVIEWVFDAGLTSEKRQLEQHTAKELGQWVEKQAATDPTGEHASDPHAALLSRIAELAARTGTDHVHPEPTGDGCEGPSD
jgi:hypothetical protein